MITDKQRKALSLGRKKGLKRNRPSGLKYKLVNKNPTSFKKGHIPWNKGTKGICKANSGSIKPGQRLSLVTEFKKGENKGSKNNKWKGGKVGYFALHTWLDRNFKKPDRCEYCNQKKDLQWSSKNYKYTRNRNDWQCLCYRCHRKYDRKNGWEKATKKFDL